MQQDIWKICLVLMASALVGLTLGYITEAMLVGALAIVAWQIYRLDLIYKWVTKPRNNPLPERTKSSSTQ